MHMLYFNSRLQFPIDNSLSPCYNVLLEPVFVSCHSPLHNDMKPIENSPDAIQTGSRSKVVWPCHHLTSNGNQSVNPEEQPEEHAPGHCSFRRICRTPKGVR